jgi:hypothetical protein
MDEEGNKKSDLLRILISAEESAAALKRRGQEVVESAAYAEGLAKATRPLIETVPSDNSVPEEVWEDLSQAWSGYVRQADISLSALEQSSTSTAATATASLTTTMASPVLTTFLKKRGPVFTRFSDLLQRPGLIEEVRIAMRAFGLHRSQPGRQSGLDLLEEAELNRTRPSGSSSSPTGVLIPARGSIEVACSDLLKRRPKQEPAGSWEAKVISIGSQCGLDRLASAHFELLGRNLRSLHAKLSGGKQDSLSSEEVEKLFDEVLKFHRAFLKSLDLAKLRP